LGLNLAHTSFGLVIIVIIIYDAFVSFLKLEASVPFIVMAWNITVY